MTNKNAIFIRAFNFYRKINYSLAKFLIEQAIERRGDYVYPKDDPDFTDGQGNCLYAREEASELKPLCIIGECANQLGILDKVHLYEGTYATHALRSTGIELTPGAEAIIWRVQKYQDDGWSWKMALEKATNDLYGKYGAND